MNKIPKAAIINIRMIKLIKMSSKKPIVPNTDSGIMSKGSSK